MAETRDGSRAETMGDKPRPIRKRGFWRAYKRGELWILVSLRTMHMMQGLERDLYGNKFEADRSCPNDSAYITWPMTGMSAWLPK